MLDQMRALCDTVFIGLMEGLDPKAKCFVEQPGYVRHLDLVAELYPDAHVVHIIRDGRDVVRSLLAQGWGPSEARDAALEWCSAIESARASAPNLLRYHEVVYEQMLADPATHVRELYTTLGLGTSDTELRPRSPRSGSRTTRIRRRPAWGPRSGGRAGPQRPRRRRRSRRRLLAELGYPPSDGSGKRASARPAVRPAGGGPRGLVQKLRSRRAAEAVEDLELLQEVVDGFLSAAAPTEARHEHAHGHRQRAHRRR